MPRHFWERRPLSERLWFSPDALGGALPLGLLIPLVIGFVGMSYYVITPTIVHEAEDVVTRRCARQFFENARELGGIEADYDLVAAVEGSDREDRNRPRALRGFFYVRGYTIPLAPFYDERPEPAYAECVLITNTGFGTSCECWMPESDGAP